MTDAKIISVPTDRLDQTSPAAGLQRNLLFHLETCCRHSIRFGNPAA
jgi:hypothetical protein